MQQLCSRPGCRRAADPNVSIPPTLCISCYYRYPDMTPHINQTTTHCAWTGCRQLKSPISEYCAKHGPMHDQMLADNRRPFMMCNHRGCIDNAVEGSLFCAGHRTQHEVQEAKRQIAEEQGNPALQIRTKLVPSTADIPPAPAPAAPMPSLAELYPQYYKDFSDVTEADVYIVHHKFNIQDPSGAIQHASKKLLLSGVRTGGKSKYDDIKEARDTLNRWLEINKK